VNLFRHAHKWENNVALQCSATGATTTYAQLKDQIARWAGFLLKQGLGAGDVVAVIAPNLNEYTPVVYGSASIGVVFTGVNPTYTPQEVANHLSDSNAKMVVYFEPLEPLVQAGLALAGKKDLPLVTIGPSKDGSPVPRASDIFADDRIPFANPVDMTGDDMFALMYSSGTTGRPKGAMISHNAAFSNTVMVNSHGFLPYDGSGTAADQKSMIQLLPMFHAGGLMGVNMNGLHGGLRMVNYLKFDPQTFMKVVSEYKVSEMAIVPAVLNYMAMAPDCNAKSLKDVKSILCGTAPLSLSLADAVLKKAGHDINFQQAYGMTEIIFATFDRYMKPKMGYTGQVVPLVQLKVIDLEDPSRNLPPGQDGEICVKTPSMMMGYLNCTGETAATIDDDGWLHTGDVGHYDEEGYVSIIDRTKDLIKVKGLQVSPSEIEDVLLAVKGVREAAVIGVPDDKLGEAPKAFVAVADDAVTAGKLTEVVASQLAPHKHLKGGVEFVKTLPRNPTGKVLKRELK